MTLARQIVPGEYYHVFNRGAHKHTLFHAPEDWKRMLFYILYLQSPHAVAKPARAISRTSLEDGFSVSLEKEERIISDRLVELVSFCLMPNHIHMLIQEKSDGGISSFMQRVNTAYTKYYNTKYDAVGHVFQGRYQTVHVKDDDQLMHLSAYIHRNPRELKAWRGKEERYPYSSLQDYVDKNRWGNLIATDIIAGRFESTPKSNYRDFVRTSSTKSNPS